MFKMRFRCQIVIITCAVLMTADARANIDNVYMARALNSDDTAINVTSDTIVVSPNYGSDQYERTMKSPQFQKYVFRPRAIVKNEPTEKSVFYARDNVNKYKTEILFPGNYFAIAKEKSDENPKESAYNPLNGGAFIPQAIPLLRAQSFEGRSLDGEDEIEKPEGFTEQSASRRSLSYIFGNGAEEEEVEEEDEENDIDEEGDSEKSKLKRKRKRKGNQNKGIRPYSKYMMPLLLAYKMKYFALVPVLLGGLLLLVGSTGIAGFFFALFAASMALQKGAF
ncbi:unnamed protein product [Leptidea sinapis]|uniref:Uncharacterized protein n=1 Tax=Leptidea sinapis TaxID=189913 RepID=A0A5E4PZH2_9NEOP|nr:unnamed protein product [Leptidea sinapis]